MASGVELAGIVLAVLPIVAKGVKEYGDGLALIHEYWRYRGIYKEFQHQIDLQTLLLRQQLEYLLGQIAQSSAQLQELIDRPDSPEWSNQDLENRLRQLLPQGAYESYICTVQDTFELLEMVKAKFSANNESAGDAPWWRRQVKRFRFVLKKSEREDVLTRLNRYTTTLENVLRSTDRVVAARKARRMREPATFRRLRLRAARLHDTLAEKWTCACKLRHSMNLSLEDYALLVGDERSSPTREAALLRQFAVLFRSDASADKTAIPWVALEALIRVAKSADTPDRPASPIVPSSSQPIPLGSISSMSTATGDQTLVGRTVTFDLGPTGSSSSVSQAQRENTSSTLPTDWDGAAGAVEILDLCRYIETANEGATGDGVLREEAALYTIHVDKGRSIQVVTLDDLLTLQRDTGSCNLSRLQRIYIAVRLVASVLPLHGTPWMGDDWGKGNVLVQLSGADDDGHSPGLERIYITPVAKPPENRSTNNCMRVLQRLGVVLLELYFGRRLEDSSGWKECLGPDGKENRFTSATAAREWHEKLLGEAGEKISEAVRRCLFFAFETASRSLDEEDLAARFFSGVVQPIQEHWKMFAPVK